MNSINHLENREELIVAFTYFKKFLLLDIEKLVDVAQGITEQEYIQAIGTTTSSTTQTETTILPGGNIVNTKMPEYTRCTIPLCMLLLSGIDFIGKLSKPLEQNDKVFDGNYGFQNNAQRFFYYLCGITDLNREKAAEILMTKYRHSIMHNYLTGAGNQKETYGIAFIHESMSGPLFYDDGKQRVLDVHTLYRHFINGINRFEQILLEGTFDQEIMDVYNNNL